MLQNRPRYAGEEQDQTCAEGIEALPVREGDDNTFANTLANLMSNIRKLEMARFMAGQKVDHLLADPLQNVHLGAVGVTAAEGSDVMKLESLTLEFTKLSTRLQEQGQHKSQGEGPHKDRNQQRGSYE